MKAQGNKQYKKPQKKVYKKPPSDSLQANKQYDAELKSFDNWIIGQSITTGAASAGHVLLMNGMIRGTDRYNRIGRKVLIKKCVISISLHPATPVPTLVPEDLLFALVWDHDAGTLPSLSQLYQDVDGVGATISTVRSGRNLDEVKRYDILRVKRIPLRNCGTATGVLPCNGGAFQAEDNNLVWTWSVPINRESIYNAGNTGVITDIANGSLVLTWWTDLGAGLPVTTFDVSTRVRFFDV